MNTPNKSKIRHPDRVTLKTDSLAQLSKWVDQLQLQSKGIRVSKTDLVNFLIVSHSPNLTEEEINQLKTQHFDEVRFYSWALSRLKAERAQGKNVSLADIVSSSQINNEKGGESDVTSQTINE